jgi:hypothetical protein
MNAKTLLPALITLHLVAAALIVDGLSVDEQESGRSNRAWQVVEWNPDCVAGHANARFARYWSDEYRQLNAMGTDQRSCVNFR